jgi:hypothetical protein
MITICIIKPWHSCVETTAAVATSVTILQEASRESPGRYRLPIYANNVVSREMSSTAPMKYYDTAP